MLVEADIVLEIKDDDASYVSRGGLKLAAAIEGFAIDAKGKVVLDIGASTGGFTDVVLRHGAKLVYALDVGTNQLADSLRADRRVIVFEQMNFRYIERDIFSQGLPQLIVTDVSFISLTYILDKLAHLFIDVPFTFIGLVKPQFELDKRKIGKKGVVRDVKVQQAAVQKITDYVQTLGPNWRVKGVMRAPITGSKGNQEFLLYVEKTI